MISIVAHYNTIDNSIEFVLFNLYIYSGHMI